MEEIRKNVTNWSLLEDNEKLNETISLRSDYQFEIKEPNNSLIGLMSGVEIKRLFEARNQKLFNMNIRQWLGRNKTNIQITDTVKNEPNEFFYYNNGITAVCDDYTISRDKTGRPREIDVKNFQIINGAQTVKSICEADNVSEDLSVLFRLIKVEKQYSGFSDKVIKYQNTQNPVKDYDFRANDFIQLF